MDQKEFSNISSLIQHGCCVLSAVFSNEEIEKFRNLIMENLAIMARTRAIAHSYHLAGFHRFPALAQLHAEVASNEAINRALVEYYGASQYHCIGLTDITINRSQQWHTDLLRGPYSSFLSDGSPWAESKGACIKALVYLQTGRSLRVVPGSHMTPSPLDDDLLDKIARTKEVVQLDLAAGDVVLMDLRSIHRGSTDTEMARQELVKDPKILVSTVFGSLNSRFTQAMQLGNAQRTVDWDRRHLNR